MSMFLPEATKQPSSDPSFAAAPGPDATSADVALMQRVLSAAVKNPNLIPEDFMAYVLDYIQTQRLQIPIGQVFGFQRIAPRVITDFAMVPDPTDGQIVLLKAGSASPFTYVQMMFDQKLGKWVSEEFPCGGAASAVAINGFVDVGGMTGISWLPVTTFGLTFQLKWAGTLENEGGGTGDARVQLVWATPGSSTTNTVMGAASVAGDTVTHPVGIDWTTVASPGNYNMVAIGFQSGRNAGSTGTTVLKAGAVGRFIR